ncbi:RNA-dependent RNA polymeras [Papaya meleira virus]|uniref:RNA-directed RNA polymerase n=1 Tax=Papaya meleira virus TaxID=1497848 RepID=A0A0P0QL14_9VIRU|nr:RNA-dependent RNA polymeras [Papaya meleira virus]ALL54979.1 RNA-dependent RNA polymeras [Papaya meleira virus]
MAASQGRYCEERFNLFKEYTSLNEFPDLNLKVEETFKNFVFKLSEIEGLPLLSHCNLLIDIKGFLDKFPLIHYDYNNSNFRNIVTWIFIEPLPREIYSYLPVKLFNTINIFILKDLEKELPKINFISNLILNKNNLEITNNLFFKPLGRLGGKTHLLIGDFLKLFNFSFSDIGREEDKGKKVVHILINKNRVNNNIGIYDFNNLIKLNKDTILSNDIIYTLISVLLYQLELGCEESWNSLNVAGLLISPITSPLGFICTLFFISSNITKLTILEASKICKKFQNTVRIGGRLPIFNIPITDDNKYFLDGQKGILSIEGIRMLYGIDSLLGPSEFYKYDPISEIITRQVHPNLELSLYKGGSRSNKAYSSTIEAVNKREEIIRQDMYNSLFFSVVKKLHRPFKTFREWFNIKFSWSASGGCPGAKVFWSESEKIRVNKRGALLNVKVDDVVKAINETYNNPVHYSKAARKYEKGKNRVIWNTTLLMYLAQSYLLYTFESILDPLQHDFSFELKQISSWNSSTANADMRFISNQERLRSLKDNSGLMFDYSDFNINHSIVVQNKLYDVLSQVLFNKMKVNQENYFQVLKDIKWITEYILRAKTFSVLDAGVTDNYVSQVMRSLESGERGTSFINTFLSNCYIRNLNTNSRSLFGRQLLINNLWLQGDDVFAMTKNLEDGCLAVNLFNCLGYAGQPSKIGLSLYNNGEFLRLSYDPSCEIIGGYPIRSTSGLISGEFFKESIYDPDTRAGCYLSSVIRCNVRGAIIPNNLIYILCQRNCRLIYTKPNSKEKIVMIGDPVLALIPSILGGFGINSILDIGMKHQVPGTDQLLNRLQLSPKMISGGWFSSKFKNLNPPKDSLPIGELFWIRRVSNNSNNNFNSYYVINTTKSNPILRFDNIPDILGDKSIPDFLSAYTICNKSLTKEITQNIVKSSVMGALPLDLLSKSLTKYGEDQLEYRSKCNVHWVKYTSNFGSLNIKLSFISHYISNFIKFLISDEIKTSHKIDISVNLNYGILPTLFIEYGFSLQENFERVIDELNTKELLELIASKQTKKFSITSFFKNILILNKYNTKLYLKWIKGKILLFPPVFSLIDSDIINIWRGWSLFSVEKMILHGVNLREDDIPYIILELELLIENYIKDSLESLNKINKFYSMQTKA